MIAAFKPDIPDIYYIDIYYIIVLVGFLNIPVMVFLIKGKIRVLKQKNFIESTTALGHLQDLMRANSS